MKSLEYWPAVFCNWLTNSALPLWWQSGGDQEWGGFREMLHLDGSSSPAPRRARVQSRQSYAFSQAGRIGWRGPWADAAQHGLIYLEQYYRRPDGLFRTLIASNGAILNDVAMTYDQAFALLAAASLYSMQPHMANLKSFALDLLSALAKFRRHPEGGFREEGRHPFLSNPHMHLLEAALAWADVDTDPIWKSIADEIVTLCLKRFIDPKTGVLREYFDSDWKPCSGDLGSSIEPGHQFEWAWLLERWARSEGREDVHAAANTLFDVGVRGVDASRNVALDEIGADLRPRRMMARLWPQTERLKASLILMESSKGEQHAIYKAHACAAAESLWGYLQTPLPGLWRDKMLPDGSYVEEPAPASSLYHIICAISCLRETVGAQNA